VKISELAGRAGVAPSTVRWYEQMGVLPVPSRTAAGYREFDEDDLSLLRLVVSLRRLGLGPREAGRVARLCLEREDVDADLTSLLAAQRDAIGERRAELDRLEAELVDLELTIKATQSHAARRNPAVSAPPIRVLFVCTGNSARSQIAEALLEHYGGPDFEVESAGSRPSRVNPLTIETLAEIGIDWSGARAKQVDEFLDQQFDYVITVCDRARTECPVLPGSMNTLHWGLDDPAAVEGTDAEKRLAFQRTRLEVASRLRPFIEIALRAAGRRGTPVISA
jgi:arsenate reductase